AGLRAARLAGADDLRQPRPAVPDRAARRVRLGLLQCRARAHGRLRPIAAAGDADDDPESRGEQTGHARKPPRLTPIPLPAHHSPGLCQSRTAFSEYPSLLMEPLDGPACVAFADGVLAGAVLDRICMPTASFVMTAITVVVAWEIGMVDIDESAMIARGRRTPG